VIDQLLLQTQCLPGGASRPLLLLVLIAGTWLLISVIRLAFKKGGANLMDISRRIAIIAAVAIAVVVVFIAKQNSSDQGRVPLPDAHPGSTAVAAQGPEQLAGQGRPALIDLGAGTCVPCKLMAPILEDLKAVYAGTMDVHVLDVHENEDLILQYAISVIPTQIFYDASGKELFRHEGFISKEDILAKWKELGIELTDAL
jgi:thioredoxin 1